MYGKDLHKDIIEHNIKLCPCLILFPKFGSLFLLRTIMENVQSLTTFKFVLIRSVYSAVTHVYRVKLNHRVSLGAYV